MLRIGQIDYANCTPLFMQMEGRLPESRFRILHGVPAQLNAKLAQGGIDICISSSIEFARHADIYEILPGYCIGSDGPVKSVLLFSNCPVEELSGKRLLVTAESATSVLLLQILLTFHWGVEGYSLQAGGVDWADGLQQAQGLLLIGDRALKAVQDGAGKYCYDLGEAWKSLTGLPFVYALWLINRASSVGKNRELAEFAVLLEQATEGVGADAELLAARAPESSWFSVSELAGYWRNSINYRLDERHLQGLEQFYSYGVQLGLLEQQPVIRLFNAAAV